MFFDPGECDVLLWNNQPACPPMLLSARVLKHPGGSDQAWDLIPRWSSPFRNIFDYDRKADLAKPFLNLKFVFPQAAGPNDFVVP
jgi:hypothetical protein